MGSKCIHAVKHVNVVKRWPRDDDHVVLANMQAMMLARVVADHMLPLKRQATELAKVVVDHMVPLKRQATILVVVDNMVPFLVSVVYWIHS